MLNARIAMRSSKMSWFNQIIPLANVEALGLLSFCASVAPGLVEAKRIPRT